LPVKDANKVIITKKDSKKVASKKDSKKVASKEETQEYDATIHVLSPKHEKLSDDQVTELLKTFNVEYAKLPKISLSDPAIENLEVKLGDVIKISRPSPTSGTTVYYRMAIEQ
tara:strand:+ start:111 stop:449 length:339 start_codon:yes stop_codon:yes gene_type:complete